MELDTRDLDALRKSADSDRQLAKELRADSKVARLLRQTAHYKESIRKKRDQVAVGMIAALFILEAIDSFSSLT